MNFDLSQLRNLSEDELAKLLYTISLSMGASEEKARKAAENTGIIKKLIDSSSDEELARIAENLQDGKNVKSIFKKQKEK